MRKMNKIHNMEYIKKIFLSVAMMLKYSLNRPEASDAIENAVAKVLETHRTPDIYEEGFTKVSCEEMGDLVCDAI
jgi:3-isopropylmalate dehydrogenase